MQLKKEFGKRIKFLREARELSQAELAELVDLECATVSRIENGENFVKADTLEKLKNAFEVSYEELFKFGDEACQDKRLKSINIQLKTLDDEALKYFLGNIKAYKRVYQNSK
jgi:transcriptional regulator with XRE-family HTH domain